MGKPNIISRWKAVTFGTVYTYRTSLCCGLLFDAQYLYLCTRKRTIRCRVLSNLLFILFCYRHSGYLIYVILTGGNVADTPSRHLLLLMSKLTQRTSDRLMDLIVSKAAKIKTGKCSSGARRNANKLHNKTQLRMIKCELASFNHCTNNK